MSPNCSLSSLLAAVALAASGCSGLFSERPEVVETVLTVAGQTNRVPVVTAEGTNWVVVIEPERTVTNTFTNLVFVPNPKLVATVRAAKAVNDAANPLPFAGAISGVLGLATVALGWLAKVKSDRAKLLPAVIQGIELAKDPGVKESVRKIATGLGLEKRLHRVVKEVTE